jgi:hypothetical protein
MSYYKNHIDILEYFKYNNFISSQRFKLLKSIKYYKKLIDRIYEYTTIV